MTFGQEGIIKGKKINMSQVLLNPENKHVLELKQIIKKFNKMTKKKMNYDAIKRNVHKVLLYGGFRISSKQVYAKYSDRELPSNVFFRSRVMSYVPKDVSELFARVASKCSLGRLNIDKESILYGTHNSLLLSLKEIRAKKRDIVMIISYKRKRGTTISLKKLGNLDGFLNKPEADNCLIEINNLKDEFIDYWMGKKISGKKNHLYNVTNAIKDFEGGNPQDCDGLIYTSIFGNDELNVAFIPNQVKTKLRVNDVWIGELLEKNKKRVIIRTNLVYKGISKGEINWEKKEKYFDCVFYSSKYLNEELDDE